MNIPRDGKALRKWLQKKKYAAEIPPDVLANTRKLRHWVKERRSDDWFRQARCRLMGKASKSSSLWNPDGLPPAALVGVDNIPKEPMPSNIDDREEYVFTELHRLKIAQGKGEGKEVREGALALRQHFPCPDDNSLGRVVRVTTAELICNTKHTADEYTRRCLKTAMIERRALGDFAYAAIDAVSLAEYYRLRLALLAQNSPPWCGEFSRALSATESAKTFAQEAQKKDHLLALTAEYLAEQITLRLYTDHLDVVNNKKADGAASRLAALRNEICTVARTQTFQSLIITDEARELARYHIIHCDARTKAADEIEVMLNTSKRARDEAPQSPSRMLIPQIILCQVEGQRDEKEKLVEEYRSHISLFPTRNQRDFLVQILQGAPLPPTDEVHIHYPLFSWLAAEIKR